MSAAEFAKLGAPGVFDRLTGAQPANPLSGLYAVGSEATAPIGTPIAPQPRIDTGMDAIETFSALLTPNKHNLDEELVMHSDVMFRITESMNAAGLRLGDAADEFKRAEADAFAAAKGYGEKGPSDKAAEMDARSNPARIVAHKALQQAKWTHERWQALYECWKQKGHTLRELSALYAAQYFSLDPAARREPTKPRTDYSRPENRTTRSRRSAAP